MLCKVAPIIFIISVVICTPHSHKSKTGSKESAEDGFTNREAKHYKDGKHNQDFDQEAILGSRAAVEEFNHLSPEEAKKKLLQLAMKMDKNNDEYVDRKELTNWVLHFFKVLTEEEALDEFEDEDVDKDGRVKWEEHATETYGIFDDNKMIYEGLPEEAQMYDNDLQLFKAADLNGDGELDKSEFPAFSHPEEFEHMHEVVYNQAMEKRDKNNDGFLSFEEFMADIHGVAPVPSTEHFIMEKDRFDNEYDLDGDKKLNKEEVMNWLIPNNEESAENEADHLIESADTDKDGKLSLGEIVENYDVFARSEVTDFGEQLHNYHKYADEL